VQRTALGRGCQRDADQTGHLRRRVAAKVRSLAWAVGCAAVDPLPASGPALRTLASPARAAASARDGTDASCCARAVVRAARQEEEGRPAGADLLGRRRNPFVRSGLVGPGEQELGDDRARSRPSPGGGVPHPAVAGALVGELRPHLVVVLSRRFAAAPRRRPCRATPRTALHRVRCPPRPVPVRRRRDRAGHPARRHPARRPSPGHGRG